MKRILSLTQISKIAIREVAKKEMKRNTITGKLESKLTNKEILIWRRAFIAGYTMGQENIKSSDDAFLTMLLEDPPAHKINYSVN